MKSLILVLLIAFSATATAGKPTKDQVAAPTPAEGNTIKLCGSGDPLKGLNVDMHKGANPKSGPLCADGGDRKGTPDVNPPKADAPAGKPQKQQQQ